MAEVAQVADAQAFQLQDVRDVLAQRGPVVLVMVGADAGDQHTGDLELPRAFDYAGRAGHRRDVVVTGMVVAHSDDVRRWLTDAVTGALRAGIHDDCRLTAAQSKT